jgi:hypothetical protein
VIDPSSGSVGRGGGCPTIRAGVVSPAGVLANGSISAPDDHFNTRPHCGVTPSAVRCVARADGCPIIGAGIISSAGIEIVVVDPVVIIPAPDDYFTAGPHCRVGDAGFGCVGRAGRRPAIRIGIVSSARIEYVEKAGPSTPDDHFTASPHCCVRAAGFGCVGRAGRRPAIGIGVVSPAGVEIREAFTNWTKSPPDNHLTPRPHCCVTSSAGGCVGRAGGRPAIGAGIVSAAGVIA